MRWRCQLSVFRRILPASSPEKRSRLLRVLLGLELLLRAEEDQSDNKRALSGGTKILKPLSRSSMPSSLRARKSLAPLVCSHRLLCLGPNPASTRPLHAPSVSSRISTALLRPNCVILMGNFLPCRHNVERIPHKDHASVPRFVPHKLQSARLLCPSPLGASTS